MDLDDGVDGERGRALRTKDGGRGGKTGGWVGKWVKENKTRQNKTKQNKTKQNKTNKSLFVCLFVCSFVHSFVCFCLPV